MKRIKNGVEEILSEGFKGDFALWGVLFTFAVILVRGIFIMGKYEERFLSVEHQIKDIKCMQEQLTAIKTDVQWIKHYLQNAR